MRTAYTAGMAGARRWTAAEDDQVRAAATAVNGWPTYASVATVLRRSPLACRIRAHRLGVTSPREPAPPKPAEAPQPCGYCTRPFLRSRGPHRDYCGDQCASLSTRHCPGCGRMMAGLVCFDCTSTRKREEPWPGPTEGSAVWSRRLRVA